MRIDKYLWSVRLFKTRSLATEACRKGQVLIDNQPVKPSREIKEEQIFELKSPPIIRKYKVIQLLKSRVGAKLVPEHLEEITPEEELLKLETIKNYQFAMRKKGAGRPTKKERRDIDKYLDT